MVVKVCTALSSLIGKCARTIAILRAKPNISPSPLKILCFVSETIQMASIYVTNIFLETDTLKYDINIRKKSTQIEKEDKKPHSTDTHNAQWNV